MPKGGHNKIHDAATPGTPMHGEYRAWLNMKARYGTTRPTPRSGVCVRWHSSSAMFLKDMGVRPKGAVLCRRDPLSYFSPHNCFWGDRAGNPMLERK